MYLTHMKAIQYERLGTSAVLEYKDVPDPIAGPNEIVYRVHAASLNHLDLHFRRGLPGMRSPLPHIPGSDGAGVVESVGKNVTSCKPGDRIVMNPGVSCERCDRCREGNISLCHEYRVLGRETDGSYAEKMAIPAKNAIPLPDHVPFDIAACAPLVYLTAWSMVVSKARVKAGQTILVMAAGSAVSIAAIQIAKYFGCKVIATASTKEKAERAKNLLPVDEALVYTECEIDREIRILTDRRGVDAVIDHVGGSQWQPILRATRNGGTVVSCGATAGFDPVEDLRHVFYRQVRILGSTMGTLAELQDVLALVFDGTLTPIVDEVFPLSSAAAAQDKMEARKSFGKIVLNPP